jgi:ribonuclease HI
MTGAGMALFEHDGLVRKWGVIPEARTNNEAEYASIIEGLKVALEMGYTEIKVLNDNKMVVNQINGKWQTHSKTLRPFLEKTAGLLQQFESWEVKWVPREFNEMVDEIAKEYSQRARGHHSPWSGAHLR